MNNKKNDLLKIVAQAFYGNRMRTEIEKEDIDGFILGYIDNSFEVREKIDRTIINVPNTDNIVIVYNKYQEEERLQRKKELLEEENYELKPLVVIAEKDIEIYSRCIVCRIDKDGNFESLQKEDYKKFMKYLAE